MPYLFAQGRARERSLKPVRRIAFTFSKFIAIYYLFVLGWQLLTLTIYDWKEFNTKLIGAVKIEGLIYLIT